MQLSEWLRAAQLCGARKDTVCRKWGAPRGCIAPLWVREPPRCNPSWSLFQTRLCSLGFSTLYMHIISCSRQGEEPLLEKKSYEIWCVFIYAKLILRSHKVPTNCPPSKRRRENCLLRRQDWVVQRQLDWHMCSAGCLNWAALGAICAESRAHKELMGR
jgi:hypothetical protein